MSDEQKVPNVNAEAEQDVQNTLAELKGEAQAPAEGAAPAKTEETEEARIVEAASKLGEKSEKAEEKTESKPQEGGSRNGGPARKGHNNIKFDPSTQKETDDPVEIRKQVSQP